MHLRLLAAIVTVLLITSSHAQNQLPPTSVPKHFGEEVLSRLTKLEQRIKGQTERILTQMEKEEEQLQKKLMSKDSVKSVELFSGQQVVYQKFHQLVNTKNVPSTQQLNHYVPYLDTLKNIVRYLSGQSLGEKDQMKLVAIQKRIDALEGQLETAGNLRQYLRERNQYLKEQFKQLGVVDKLDKFNKRAYYFSQHVRDFKDALSNPGKWEEKAVRILKQVPAVKTFLRKHSALASLFGVEPGSAASPQVSPVGVQTRASVQQAILTSTAASSQGGGAAIQQQLSSATKQLEGLQTRIAFVDLSGDAEPYPGFKPNTQRTKTLFDRVEWGANVQFGKINRLLPLTMELGLSAGYRINDRLVMGIGASYKLGLRSPTGKLHFSHQGVGQRSFLNWKLKGKIWLNGAYERNFWPELLSMSALPPVSKWQESGLVGISRKYDLPKNKKGYVQLLFNFLSHRNIPRSQPLVLRTGVNF